MKGLSKSRYTAFCQCPKNLWLKVFKPEEATVDAGLQARFEQGNETSRRRMLNPQTADSTSQRWWSRRVSGWRKV